MSSKYFHKAGPLIDMLLTSFAYLVGNLKSSKHFVNLRQDFPRNFRNFCEFSCAKMRKIFYESFCESRKFLLKPSANYSADWDFLYEGVLFQVLPAKSGDGRPVFYQ
jgi:hypothetical protein